MEFEKLKADGRAASPPRYLSNTLRSNCEGYLMQADAFQVLKDFHDPVGQLYEASDENPRNKLICEPVTGRRIYVVLG